MIRPATEGDIGALVAMARRFWHQSQYFEWLNFSSDAVEALLTKMVTTEGCAVFVTEALNAAIGVTLAESVVSGERIATELFWWADPSARGVGMRLLRAAETWCRENDVRQLTMVAPEKAPEVHRLYERVGYRPVERLFVRDF